MQTDLFHFTTRFGPAGPSLVYVTPVEHSDIFRITDTQCYGITKCSEHNFVTVEMKKICYRQKVKYTRILCVYTNVHQLNVTKLSAQISFTELPSFSKCP